MEATGEMLFLLSSTDRLNLLLALREERLRLTRLSSKLSITVQETSRQLARLESGGLVERDSKGLFGLTGFGSLALTLLPSFDFLVKRRDYLMRHDLSALPPEFIERIGELSGGEYGEALSVILDHFERVLEESRKYVWLMADQILLTDSIIERLTGSEGVPMKIIIPSAVLEGGVDAPLPKEFKGRVELGLVEEVKQAIAMNEKTAGVTFPDNAGKVDFGSGFQGSDPKFHRWCKDLFLFHWDRARVIR